jgi:hypothetical protein
MSEMITFHVQGIECSYPKDRWIDMLITIAIDCSKFSYLKENTRNLQIACLYRAPEKVVSKLITFARREKLLERDPHTNELKITMHAVRLKNEREKVLANPEQPRRRLVLVSPIQEVQR